jgi:hypothetical protein
MTEPAPTTTGTAKPDATPARPTPTRGHAARGSRIVVAGLAAGAGLGLVGAMSAAARSSTQTVAAEPVRRVIVVDRTAGSGTSPSATGGTAPAESTSPQAVAPEAPAVVAEPAPLPLPPPPDPQPAPPVTQSEGS